MENLKNRGQDGKFGGGRAVSHPSKTNMVLAPISTILNHHFTIPESLPPASETSGGGDALTENLRGGEYVPTSFPPPVDTDNYTAMSLKKKLINIGFPV